MNPFDMAIVVILGYCMIVGIFKGFIKEVASIVGIIGGFYAAYAGRAMFVPFIAPWIKTPAYRDIIAFIAVFISVCLIVHLIGALLRLLIKLVLLGVVDRFFGAVLGAFKGVLMASFLYVLLIAFLPIGGKQLIAEARLAPFVNSVSRTMVRVIPVHKRRAFMQGMEQLKKEWASAPEPGHQQ